MQHDPKRWLRIFGLLFVGCTAGAVYGFVSGTAEAERIAEERIEAFEEAIAGRSLPIELRYRMYPREAERTKAALKDAERQSYRVSQPKQEKP